MHVLANISVKPSGNYITQQLIPFFSDFTLLFMVVSAFSMCCGYYVRIKSGGITPNNFYRKRYLRILPYFAMLCLLDFVLEPNLDTLYQVFANLTLCFNLLPQAHISVIGVGWFLGLIFLFYMLFPFFVFIIDNKRRAWLGLGIALLLVFIGMNGQFVGRMTRTNIIFCAPFFILGGIVYLYRKRISEFGKSHSLVCVSITVILTICYFIFRDIAGGFASYVAEVLLFVLWLIYAIGAKDIVLKNKIVNYLSGISMEIYLAHMVLFRIVEKIHVEKYIFQADCLYIVTCLLTIIGVICFAHVMKYMVLNRILSRISKINRLFDSAPLNE